VTGRIKAGNFYVNRNQIGAIAGSQPFGGNSLSGTGPKAGGPAYVPRYTRAAQGGGIEGAPEALADLPPFDAVIYWGNPTKARAYLQALASRPGPILPPFTETGPTPRLIVERHTCIDTRAVGGNVALLASVA
jgi:RHH-type proline utilization regulon transcriptional repressor/proline dehydrogenase/delta 1-pyrroline-5-carboxylate dehydrogenase